MKLIKSGLTFNQALRRIIKNNELLISRKEWKEGYHGKRYLNFKDWGDSEYGEICCGLRDTEFGVNKDCVLVFSSRPDLLSDDFLAKDWEVWEWEDEAL